jgi:NADH:ubiquinone oxidoreductase subunit 6 (subunit J)
MPDVPEIFLIGLITVITAFFSIQSKNNPRSIIFLWMSSVAVGFLLFLFSATYAAVLQWLIYGGVLILLFMTFTAFAGNEPESSTLQDGSLGTNLEEQAVLSYWDVIQKEDP